MTATVRKAARGPGRPLAAESRHRRTRMVKAARVRFGRRGYDGTTLSAVAADTGVTLAAIYRYVENKHHLYRLVFSETVSDYWTRIRLGIERARPEQSFSAQLSALLDAVHQVAEPEGNDFLAAMGIEVRRHPELADLTKERDRVRDPVFASLLDQSLGGGSLVDGDHTHQVLMLRIVIMGWALEHDFNPQIRPQLDAALRGLAAVLDTAKRPASLSAPGLTEATGGRPRNRRGE